MALSQNSTILVSDVKDAIKSITREGTTFTYTCLDGSTGTFTQKEYPNMTAATADTAGGAGLVPAPEAGKQTSFLRGDGTWVVPTNTTYSNFTKATASAAGTAGLVPAPAAGNQAKFLRGDATWQTITQGGTSSLSGGTTGFAVAVQGNSAVKATQSGGFTVTNTQGSSDGNDVIYNVTLKLPSGGTWRWGIFSPNSNAYTKIGQSAGGAQIGSANMHHFIAVAVKYAT